MTNTDIAAMERDLVRFHELKNLQIVKGVYKSSKWFDRIPKLHMLSHYAHMIRELGTPDRFNMETPECLHIEYAKEPWRASNKVKPMPQMVMYLQRQEAIQIHCAYMDLYLGLDSDEDDDVDDCVFDRGDVDEGEETVEVLGLRNSKTHDEGSTTAKGNEGELGEELEAITYPNPRRQMAKHLTKQNVPLLDVIAKYGASDIIPAITAFLGHRLGVPSHDVLLSPHNYVNVWHKLYLHHQPPAFAPFDPRQRDVVRASPLILDACNRLRIEPFWDMALYLEKPN